MYVVPYLMGPADSPNARVGIEITDSAYVVANLRIMTRMGDVALRRSAIRRTSSRGCTPSAISRPSAASSVTSPRRARSGASARATAATHCSAKKCHALRLASVEARDEGWLAEHMLIVGITNPEGRTTYLAAAFPSACGKTNLAMLHPEPARIQGRDGRRRHLLDARRQRRAPPRHQPRSRDVRHRPRHQHEDQPQRHARASTTTPSSPTSRCTPEGTPWWEGMDPANPRGVAGMTDWRGREVGPIAPSRPRTPTPATRSRCVNVRASAKAWKIRPAFPSPASSSAAAAPRRRRSCSKSTSFNHGVYVGATMVSETTAAATGATGVPRHDPMAMLPFCGYNMGDYFGHWLEMGPKLKHPPKVFHVNWFRQGKNGRSCGRDSARTSASCSG